MAVVDAFLAVVIWIGPVVTGYVCGRRFGRSAIGFVLSLGLGVVLTLGGLALWYLDAPANPGPYDCYECSEYWGRWMDHTMFTVWLPATLVLWFIGVAVGAGRLRLRRHATA